MSTEAETVNNQGDSGDEGNVGDSKEKESDSSGEKESSGESQKGESLATKGGENAEEKTNSEGDSEANSNDSKGSGEKGSEKTKESEEEVLKLQKPKGSDVDDAYIAEVTNFAKTHEINNKAAQAILERDINRDKAAIKDYESQVKKEQEQWVKTITEDQDVGGSSLNKNMELTRRMIDKFGSPELAKRLDETGLGNHPELFRFIVKSGKALGIMDDEAVHGSGGGKAKTALEKLYPTHSQKGN